MDIVIPNALTQIKDAHGNILLEADLFDISHFVGSFMAEYREQHPEMDTRNSGMARIQMFQELASQFNAFFNCNFRFSAMSQLVVDVERQIQEIKKKAQTPDTPASSTSLGSSEYITYTPDGLIVTNSTPSTPASQS